MESKLLGTVSWAGIPNDGSLQAEAIVKDAGHTREESFQSEAGERAYFINTCAEDIIAFFIPFQGKYRTFMLA